MTDQQALIYRQWLDEGTARLAPVSARPGWWVLLLRQGERETPVRYLGPKNAKRLHSAPSENAPVSEHGAGGA